MWSKRMRRYWISGLLVINVLSMYGLFGCEKIPEKESKSREISMEDPKKRERAQDKQLWEKGYALPVEEREQKEAQRDGKTMMNKLLALYRDADKGKTFNVELKEETILQMQEELGKTKSPVMTLLPYENMINEEKVDTFLKDCAKGQSGSVILYEIHHDGGVGRMKFIFDGRQMYLLRVRYVWKKDGQPGISDISHSRIKEWNYTDKGWFAYELCVPQPPEVSEIVDGSNMIRVKPMTEEQQRMSKQCVRGLGYQGNNVLCSNWDEAHMEKLDYNGMFEYLYAMKYGESLDTGKYPEGIPREKFEKLIGEYFPIAAEQIREYAVFEEKTQTYPRAGLRSFSHAMALFQTSLPEVTAIRQNQDGTVTLTVDAVCTMFTGDDALITHELTVRFGKDGRFQYLGNKIKERDLQKIPAYQYRVPRSLRENS